jgi:hypothetical protein
MVVGAETAAGGTTAEARQGEEVSEKEHWVATGFQAAAAVPAARAAGRVV